MVVRKSGSRTHRRAVPRRAALRAAIAAVLAVPLSAAAFEINTGNEDLAIRWDNTIRYNLGIRAQHPNPQIEGNPNFDDGDRNFSDGSIVTNRFDVLSEFDFIYKRSYGFRVSAAGWWDAAYSSFDNTNTATANTLVNGLPVAGTLSPYTKRYSKGVSGEVLDAFVFGNFDAGNIPINVKAGQHTVFWGDSLLLGGAIHSVSYAQNSLDIQKGFATPGAEAKELFRPKGGVTLQVQPTNELSVAGQWFYNWQAARLPESGAYLTISDGLNFGGDSLIVGANPFAALIPGSPALLRVWNTQAVADSRYSGSIGDWGLSARWSPAWLDGTLGFYGRNATDIFPQVLVTQGFAAVPSPQVCLAVGGQPLAATSPTPCIINPKATNQADLTTKGKAGTYATAYGDNIHIYGITLAKSIGGVSVGAEVSYRQNMPLQSIPIPVLPALLVPSTQGAIPLSAVPSNNKGTPGPLGDTYHALVNAIGILPKTPFFDTATVQTELTWMQLGSVTQNKAACKCDASYTAIDAVSKNFVGLAINITPTWFQVFPGVDMSAPVAWQQGLSGNAAVQFGGNEGSGNWSAGIAADIYQKYKVSLAYNGSFGNYTIGPTGAMNANNGSFASLSDRGWWSLTFKTTF